MVGRWDLAGSGSAGLRGLLDSGEDWESSIEAADCRWGWSWGRGWEHRRVGLVTRGRLVDLASRALDRGWWAEWVADWVADRAGRRTVWRTKMVWTEERSRRPQASAGPRVGVRGPAAAGDGHLARVRGVGRSDVRGC